MVCIYVHCTWGQKIIFSTSRNDYFVLEQHRAEQIFGYFSGIYRAELDGDLSAPANLGLKQGSGAGRTLLWADTDYEDLKVASWSRVDSNWLRV